MEQTNTEQSKSVTSLHVTLWWVYNGRVQKYRDLLYIARVSPMSPSDSGTAIRA